MNELVFDQPIETGPIRAEFFGDTEKAKGYLTASRKLLGSVKAIYGVNQRMAEGEAGGFYRHLAQLEDGTQIEVLTNNGMDTVRIYAVPVAPPVPEIPEKDIEKPIKEEQREKKMREFCIIGADSEVYSATISALSMAGPLIGIGGIIYMGGNLSGSYGFPSYKHDSQMFAFNADTLVQTGGFVLSNPIFNTSRTAMSWDKTTGLFFLSDFSQAAGVMVKYGLVVWGDSVTPRRALLPSESLLYPGQGTPEYVVSNPSVYGGIAIVLSSTEPENYVWIFDTTSQTEKIRVSDPGIIRYAGYTNASFTPKGDVIFLSPLLQINGDFELRIKRIGLASGNDRSYPFPGSSNINNVRQDRVLLVTQNDDETLWLLESIYDGTNNEAQALYRFEPKTGAWESIIVDGGFGNRGDSSGNQFFLFHDPVSDAIAVVIPNASGAWIFNAIDCMEIEIAPFFFAFQNPPATDNFYPQQFYDGRLLVRYQNNFNNMVGSWDHIAGSYQIGVLQQTKIEEEDFS